MVRFGNSGLKATGHVQAHDNLEIFCCFGHECTRCRFFVDAPIFRDNPRWNPKRTDHSCCLFFPGRTVKRRPRRETEPVVRGRGHRPPHVAGHRGLCPPLLWSAPRFTGDGHLFTDRLPSSAACFIIFFVPPNPPSPCRPLLRPSANHCNHISFAHALGSSFYHSSIFY